MSVTRRSERARNLRARAAELPWPRCATSFYRPVLFCRSACGPPADVLVTLSVIERARWHDRPDHRRALAHRLGWRCVDDSTDLNGAVVSSLSTLDAEPAASDVTWRDGAVVLFTDGTDQHVFSIGLGGEVYERCGSRGRTATGRLRRRISWTGLRGDRGAGCGPGESLLRARVLQPQAQRTHTLRVVANLDSASGALVGSLRAVAAGV